MNAETMGMLIILRDQLIQAEREKKVVQEAKQASKAKKK
jgi:hypothetical protein